MTPSNIPLSLTRFLGLFSDFFPSLSEFQAKGSFEFYLFYINLYGILISINIIILSVRRKEFCKIVLLVINIQKERKGKEVPLRYHALEIKFIEV